VGLRRRSGVAPLGEVGAIGRRRHVWGGTYVAHYFASQY
jgi:hypothetical protein